MICSALIVDGRILHLFWFDACASVSIESYHAILENNLSPEVETTSSSRQYYHQRKGAKRHCLKKSIKFILPKIQRRVISRPTNHPWPALSPDVSPLDYWFRSEINDVIAR